MLQHIQFVNGGELFVDKETGNVLNITPIEPVDEETLFKKIDEKMLSTKITIKFVD